MAKFGHLTDRKAAYLERSIERLEAKHEEVVRKLEELNAAYVAGVLDQAHYLHHRDAILEGKNELEWQKDFVSRKAHFEEALHAITQEQARSYVVSSAKKAFSFAAAIILIIAAIAGVPLQPSITGFASDSAGFESEANITAYFAVAMSGNLSEGIAYSTITAGTDDNNATENFNDGSNGTTLFMAVSADSNVPVDFCIKADGNLTSAEDILGLGNMTWNSSASTGLASPAIAGANALTLGYVKSEEGVAAGNNAYYRFWLDVPLGQKSGTYNNTVTFESVQNGQGC